MSPPAALSFAPKALCPKSGTRSLTGSKGGVGITTVASNLAVHLAMRYCALRSPIAASKTAGCGAGLQLEGRNARVEKKMPPDASK
jgi:hypothetical protein